MHWGCSQQYIMHGLTVTNPENLMADKGGVAVSTDREPSDMRRVERSTLLQRVLIGESDRERAEAC